MKCMRTASDYAARRATFYSADMEQNRSAEHVLQLHFDVASS